VISIAVTRAGRSAHARRPHVNPWLVAVVALAAALVGLSTWVIVDRTTNASTAPVTSPTLGLASPEVTTMLENRIAAWDSGDGKAVAAFYSKNAVMEERDVTPAVVTTGRTQIGTRLQWIIDLGLRMKPVGTPVQVGRFVGEPVRFYAVGGGAVGEGVLVFELDKYTGKIAHQWVTGEVRG
jgi:hypothetical protein